MISSRSPCHFNVDAQVGRFVVKDLAEINSSSQWTRFISGIPAHAYCHPEKGSPYIIS